MSELVKRWRSFRNNDIMGDHTQFSADELPRYANNIGDKMADEIERLEKEVSHLQSLAVCSSDEGTCFYYKDEFEVMRKERDELKAIFPQICRAIGNGACCSEQSSTEFLTEIPNEISAVIKELKARLAKYENDQPSFNEIVQAIPVYGCPVTTFKKESK